MQVSRRNGERLFRLFSVGIGRRRVVVRNNNQSKIDFIFRFREPPVD